VTEQVVWLDGQPASRVICRTVMQRKGRMGVIVTTWFLDETGGLLGYAQGTEGYVLSADWRADDL